VESEGYAFPDLSTPAFFTPFGLLDLHMVAGGQKPPAPDLIIGEHPNDILNFGVFLSLPDLLV
jgi:hypothetical protein